MSQYRQINVRSPFYVKLETIQTEAQLNLRVWNGDIVTDRPSNSTHTLNIQCNRGHATFEVSELIRDTINHNVGYQGGAVWVEASLDDFVLSASTTKYLATDGYNTHTEDAQHNGEFWLADYVMLPKDMYGNYRITGTKGEDSRFQVLVNATNSTDWIKTINYNDGTPSLTTTYTPTTNSNSIVRTITIGDNVESVDLNLDGERTTIHHDIFECNQYNNGSDDIIRGYIYTYDKPIILSYVNKLGAKNTFAFTLKHTEELNTTSNSYSVNVANYDDLNSRNIMHSSRKQIMSTTKVYTINTDFINEYYVNQLEELMLSEFVWAKDYSESNSFVPVKITNHKIAKRNHLNDRMIQYTFSYELARDYINTIR